MALKKYILVQWFEKWRYFSTATSSSLIENWRLFLSTHSTFITEPLSKNDFTLIPLLNWNLSKVLRSLPNVRIFKRFPQKKYSPINGTSPGNKQKNPQILVSKIKASLHWRVLKNFNLKIIDVPKESSKWLWQLCTENKNLGSQPDPTGSNCKISEESTS